MTGPSILSLCSGIGGLELGIERATNGHTVLQVERDEYARMVLSRHWPDVQILNNVTLVDKAWRGVDIVCAGFPCQPHSLAGERMAGDDERNLWPEMVRILNVVRPKIVVFENVVGILTSRSDPNISSTSGHFFHSILQDCERAGYFVRWDCCSASQVGATHQRDRIFLVLTKNDTKGYRSIWPFQCSMFGVSKMLWPRAGAWSEGNAYVYNSLWPETEFSKNGDEVTDCRWPTPTARDWRSGKHSDHTARRNARPLSEVAWAVAGRPELGSLNPEWVETLMGYPVGYTAHEGPCMRDVPALPFTSEPDVSWFIENYKYRKERIHCLGNAVVPQVSEIVARAFLLQQN